MTLDFSCKVCGLNRCNVQQAWYEAQHQTADEIDDRVCQEYIDQAVDALLQQQGVSKQRIGNMLVTIAAELLGPQLTIESATRVAREKGAE